MVDTGIFCLFLVHVHVYYLLNLNQMLDNKYNYTLYKKYFVLIGPLQVYLKQISRLSSEFATILVPLGYLPINLPFLPSAGGVFAFLYSPFLPSCVPSHSILMTSPVPVAFS
jgi:hypothetical protein